MIQLDLKSSKDLLLQLKGNQKITSQQLLGKTILSESPITSKLGRFVHDITFLPLYLNLTLNIIYFL